MNCKYCQRPVGETVDPWGGKHGWTHNPDDGPDAFVYCGDDFGTVATPESTLIDGLIGTVMAVESAARQKAYVTPNTAGFSQADYDEFIDGQL